MEPKQVIDKIRSIRFGIGLDTTNLDEKQKAALKDKEIILKNASRLAEEIHSENPHFIFELIQNAEDNNYRADVRPTLKFILDSDRLIIQNNERGFTEEDVNAICGIGGSNKSRARGYIGEKGIGFKSVFMVSDKVQIFSNGYQFGFSYNQSDPVSMIIPEWIDLIPEFVDLRQTNIVLYLKPQIKEVISSYFEEIHPSLLLFLKKLKVIVIENRNENRIMKIERQKKGKDMYEVTCGEKKSYWKVIKKSFEVPRNLDEKKREDIKETEIILAFPCKGNHLPNFSDEQFVFAFLPIRKYGFKFVIQADFILPITREDIIKDNRWNMWLRDAIAEVFLIAIDEFKKEKNLKYSFYNYLSFEEVKDDFFMGLVEQVFEELQRKDCIITETNKWRTPSEVMTGDSEVRKVITNKNLQELMGKEYTSLKLKAPQWVLHKLGVKAFSFNDLTKCLENSEWIRKQRDEWFVSLFEYLSKKNLSSFQMERLRDLKIIRLENSEVTSISEGVVFFPIEEKKEYGFESELRIVKKRVVELISGHKTEVKERILKFLEELGVGRADPHAIITKHILPLYENGGWRQKDLKVLSGYIKYIKDNFVKEWNIKSDGNSYTWGSRERLLLRLKRSLLLYTDKGVFSKPEDLYLPGIYGNENNLEKLLKGSNVYFVHSCYIKNTLENIDRKIHSLETKLKMKKGGRQEVEKQIKELQSERNKTVKEWKRFLLDIGVWETIIVKIDPSTEIYQGPRYADNEVTRKIILPYQRKETIWAEEKWEETDWRGYYIEKDWVSPHLDFLLSKLQEECYEDAKAISGELLKLFEKYWVRIYRKMTQTTYYYRLYGFPGWRAASTKSTFYLKLLKSKWIPTTQGTLVVPSEVFLNISAIQNILGNSAPYLAVDVKNEDFIEALGINSSATTDKVLNYLKFLVRQREKDKEKFVKLYEFLENHFDEEAEEIKQVFYQNALIFIPETGDYYTCNDVLWEDVNDIFGSNKVYLVRYYPQFKKFFVEKLGVSEKPMPIDYAKALISLSEKEEVRKEDIKLIVKIYEELNRNLNPEITESLVSQKNWWSDFINSRIFFTEKGSFLSNSGNIFVNDKTELYKLFKNKPNVNFLWLPRGYHPDKIKFFIEASGLRYLSKSVEYMPLLVGKAFVKNEELTQLVQSAIPYVLRYLYWKENPVFEVLKGSRLFEKIIKMKVVAVDDLKVEYVIDIKQSGKARAVATKESILYNNSLFVVKNNEETSYIAVALSEFLGGIKGLDDFLMNIFNALKAGVPKAEVIMKAKGIDELPKLESDTLKRRLRTGLEAAGKIEKQNHFTENESQDINFKEREIARGSSSKDGEVLYQQPERLTEEDIALFNQRVGMDESDEKEWTPDYSPEEVPINIVKFSGENKDRGTKKVESRKSLSADKSYYENMMGFTGTQSKEVKKEIGRWGERYAFMCIKKELMEKYSPVNLIETEEGFKLEKDSITVARVIWLNKNGESGGHYDIKIEEKGKEIFVEVKTTKDYNKTWFQVSKNQWKLMEEKTDKFFIYRVYGAGTEKVRLEKIPNPAKLWREGQINAYPIEIEL